MPINQNIEQDWNIETTNDTIGLVFQFQGSTYMEIEQVRAFSFQSAIEKASKYFGLFLGYAFYELPGLMRDTHSWIINITNRK